MFKLALRNIFRQKIHTAMTLGAISCGVAGLILMGGWVNDIFVKLSEALIHSQSGHLQVYKTGFFAAGSHAPEKYLIDESDRIKRFVSNEAAVDMVMSRLNFAGLLNNGRSDLPIIGEGVEAGLDTLLASSVSITEGRPLENRDTFGILLGHGVAAGLKLKPGDQTTC